MSSKKKNRNSALKETNIEKTVEAPVPKKNEPSWWTWERISSIIIAVTAIGSLFYASQSLKWTREAIEMNQRHLRLSVTPHLRAGWTTEDVDDVKGIVVWNDGIGPARIKDVKIFWDSVPIKGNPQAVVSVLASPLMLGALGIKFSITILQPDTYINVAERRYLFSIERNHADWPKFQKALIDHLGIKITYISNYGEEFLIEKGKTGKPVLEKGKATWTSPEKIENLPVPEGVPFRVPIKPKSDAP